jgi:hypothetical protein
MTDRPYVASTRLTALDSSAHWRRGADAGDVDRAIAWIAERCERGEFVALTEYADDGRVVGRWRVEADGRRTVL